MGLEEGLFKIHAGEVNKYVDIIRASGEFGIASDINNSFEAKIDAFFEYIKKDDLGKRLVAKITDDGNAFSQEEIYHDFSKLYRKYTLLNKDLGEFFKRETRDSLNQLCDDFERSLKNDTLSRGGVDEGIVG